MRRKWRHHCRAKIGDKFALSLAKNSHLSFPPSHFPSLPSRRGHQRRKWRHHCRAKIGDKFALSLAKNSHLSFPPSHFPSLPSRRGHLYETSKNLIKLIPKPIGNRKRDCLISYCWYNPQPMRNDHSIAGTTILQTTLEDACNTQFALCPQIWRCCSRLTLSLMSGNKRFNRVARMRPMSSSEGVTPVVQCGVTRYVSKN